MLLKMNSIILTIAVEFRKNENKRASVTSVQIHLDLLVQHSGEFIFCCSFTFDSHRFEHLIV